MGTFLIGSMGNYWIADNERAAIAGTAGWSSEASTAVGADLELTARPARRTGAALPPTDRLGGLEKRDHLRRHLNAGAAPTDQCSRCVAQEPESPTSYQRRSRSDLPRLPARAKT